MRPPPFEGYETEQPFGMVFCPLLKCRHRAGPVGVEGDRIAVVSCRRLLAPLRNSTPQTESRDTSIELPKLAFCIDQFLLQPGQENAGIAPGIVDGAAPGVRTGMSRIEV